MKPAGIFISITVEERGEDIHLVQLEVIDSDRSEHDTRRGELDDRGIRFPIFHPMHLAKTYGYDAKFRSGVLERENVHARQDVHVRCTL